MKRLKKCLAFVLLLCLFCPTLFSHAEGGSAAERGLEKLKTARNWDCIVLPQEEMERMVERFKGYGKVYEEHEEI